VEIISINESVSILINHIERFFEFLKTVEIFPSFTLTQGLRTGRTPEDIWRVDDCIKDNKLPGFDPEQTLQRHLKLHVVLSFLAF
jgi:hypothetical protein